MSRYDRKRWWDGKPQTRQDRRKWYGILAEARYGGWTLAKNNNPLFEPMFKSQYRIAEWVKGVVYYVDQKFTLEEAEAMCKLLNAAEETKE